MASDAGRLGFRISPAGVSLWEQLQATRVRGGEPTQGLLGLQARCQARAQ